MGMMNTDKRYGAVARFLHGIIFILVLLMIVGGFFLDEVPKEYKGVIYNLHKLTGLAILLLMLIRLCWSLVNIKPAVLPNTPPWQHKAERIVHGCLYLFIIAMPLVGWIGSSAAGKPPHLGDLSLGLPVTENKELAETLFESHELIAFVIIFLVSVHVVAALYHHFFKKDDILRRMFLK